MARLNREEKKLTRSFEKGEWQSVGKLHDEKRKHQAYARATFQKDRRINIRLSAKDLEGVQERAMEEGIPYQTLISSILHKYVTGLLLEKRR